jgi:hypothetical protein
MGRNCGKTDPPNDDYQLRLQSGVQAYRVFQLLQCINLLRLSNYMLPAAIPCVAFMLLTYFSVSVTC